MRDAKAIFTPTYLQNRSLLLGLSKYRVLSDLRGGVWCGEGGTCGIFIDSANTYPHPGSGPPSGRNGEAEKAPPMNGDRSETCWG